MEREQEEQLYRLQADLCRVLAEPHILEACRITRDVLLQQLTQQARLVAPLVEASGG
jgi:hypothetical protein